MYPQGRGERLDSCGLRMRRHVSEPALGINSGRGVTAEHFLPILIHRGELQVDKLLAAFRDRKSVV